MADCEYSFYWQSEDKWGHDDPLTTALKCNQPLRNHVDFNYMQAESPPFKSESGIMVVFSCLGLLLCPPQSCGQ